MIGKTKFYHLVAIKFLPTYRLTILKWLLCGILFSLLQTKAVFAESSLGQVALFDEICAVVEHNFYDTQKIEAFFKSVKDDYRDKLNSATSHLEFATLINEMLAELKTSHTHYYTRKDPEYFQLAAIFHFRPEIKKLFQDRGIQYPSIGVLTQQFGGKVFIVSVLAGSRADSSGVLMGDEILSVDGRPYSGTSSFEDKAGKPVIVGVRRQAGHPVMKVRVVPELISPQVEFLHAEEASARVFKIEEKKIAYIHLWSYAGHEYHDAFLEALTTGVLKSADALIWDLRDGWGGASARYLNVFNRKVPVYTRIDQDGRTTPFDTQWRKPVVMLVNGRVRSGKEMLAYGFKKHKLGTIVGEKTAGAVVAGKLFVLSDGSILYLAVSNAHIDGEILEGVGVEPDVEVPMDIRYASGNDVQLEKAISILSQQLEPGIPARNK